MQVVLTVLGILLKVFLWIVLISLLLFFLLLFLPIRYRVNLEYQKELAVRGRVTWLGGLVFIRFSYLEGKGAGKFRLLGFDVAKLLALRKRKKKREGSSENLQDRPKKEDQEKVLHVEENHQEKTKEKESWYRKWKKELLYRFDCIKKFLQSIRRLLHHIRKKIEWCNAVRTFWKEENTKRMVCILKDNVVHLWRKLKPRVVRAKVEFGLDDPCATGQILGVAAMFYGCYGKDVQFIPDFEGSRLEGNAFVKGRIALITLVLILVRILSSREWNHFKNGIEELKEAL